MASDDVTAEFEPKRVESYSESVISAASGAIKSRLRQGSINLQYSPGLAPAVVLPRFDASEPEALYRRIIGANRLFFCRQGEAAPHGLLLVEEFATSDDLPNFAEVFSAMLDYLGFDSRSRQLISVYGAREKALILEDALVLWGMEEGMRRGYPLDELTDDLLETIIDERFRLAESLLISKEQRFLVKKEERVDSIDDEMKRVREFRRRFRLEGVENGVGAVPAREVFKSDRAFRRYLETLRAKRADRGQLLTIAPTAICDLVGKRQYELHGGLDAFEHTLNMSGMLNTDRFQAPLGEYVRVAALLHDAGKSIDPLNVNHAFYSDYLAEPILKKMEYKEEERKIIRMLIRYHDAFGFLMKGQIDEMGLIFDMLPPLESPFSLEEMVEAAYEITRADITSIPWTRAHQRTKETVPPKEKVLANLAASFDGVNRLCLRLEKENQAMDAQVLPPLETPDTTVDTLVFDIVRQLAGENRPIPPGFGEFIPVMIDVLLQIKPDLFAVHPAAHKIANVRAVLKNQAGSRWRRIDEFVAAFYLEIADAILAAEQRNLGTSPKTWRAKREIFEVRRLLRRDWSEVVAKYVHGSSTFSFDGLAQEGGLIASTKLDERVRMIGEADLGLVSKKGVFVSPKTRPVREYVYVSENLAVARAYARLNEAGEGYNLHPLYVAESAAGHTGKMLIQLEEIREQALLCGEHLPEEPLARYRALEEAGRRLFDLQREARMLVIRLGQMDFSLTKLRYLAGLEFQRQRDLLTARPIIYGFTDALAVDPEYYNDWLEERRVGEMAHLGCLSHFYVDSRYVDNYRGRWSKEMGGNVEVVSIQALDIYASIMTRGDYDDRATDVYNRLYWRPLEKLGQGPAQETDK